jgi:hypothetical protein
MDVPDTSLKIVDRPTPTIQVIGQHQNDVVEWMIPLGEDRQLLAEQSEHRLKSVATATDAEDVTMLLSGNWLRECVVGSQIAAVTSVTLAAWKRCVVCIAGYTFAARFIELPGVIHRLAGTDEPNVHLVLVASSAHRSWSIQRDTGLGIAMLLAACKQQLWFLQEVRGATW